jgi:ribosomal protein S11
MNLGKVKEVASSFVKLLVGGKSDVRTAPQSLPFGIDSKPIEGQIGVYIRAEDRSKSAVLGYIRESDITTAGETRIYATDSEGVTVFDVILKANGTCELGGNTDNLVRYSDLKTNYDKTKAVVDAILQAINVPVNEPGNGAPSAFQAAMLAATTGKTTGDISGAKITEIKTI